MSFSHIHESAQVALISDLNWQINSVADLNGDGKDDILLRHAINGTVWKYIMNSSTITSSGKVMSAGSNWKLMVTADFDGDNDADLLWRDTDSGRNYVYLLDNGVVNWNNRGQISKFTDQLWVPVMAGDFDGDGDDDIFWHHFGNGKNYLYLMNGKLLDLKYINTISDTNWVPAN